MSDTQENHDKAVQAEETSGQEQGKPELPASETFYRTIGEAVPDFIWACTADGKALYVNARWTEYTGLTLEQADSVPAEVMHHPEDYPKLLEIMRTALANKAPFEAEFRFRRYDGTYHWFMARAVPVKDAEGNILQWIGTTTDIEKRKATEEALKASEERFRFALANSSISVYMQDRDLRYTWVYSGAANAELTELYGKKDAEFLEADDAAWLTEIKRRVLQTGVEERHVVRATRQGQEPGYYDTRFAPLRDAEGMIVGVTGTVNDITVHKQAQDALARHQAEIEALNMRLRRSMSETHHRVKNNLQVISALLDLQEMQHTATVPVAEIARLRQHIRALAAIHDLLTFQAKTDTEVDAISVKAAIEKLMPILQGMVNGRRIHFALEDLRLPVRQSTTLTVLLNELVSNAIKHGQGEIEVSFAITDDTARLEVCDQGPGFPVDFDPATAGNTGFDLVQALAQWDLQGSARFENRHTGGARAIVEFPVPDIE